MMTRLLAMNRARRIAVAVALVLAGAPTMVPAAELPLSRSDPQQQGIESLQDCARAALRAAVVVGGITEAGGALYTQGGKCYFTLPVSQHLRTAVDYRVAIPAGSTLAALYHTHPGDLTYADHFSPSDLALANRMKVPMYVGVVDTRCALVWQGRLLPTFHFSPRLRHGERIISVRRRLAMMSTARSGHDTPIAVYRLNRLTGGVSFCNPYVGCRPLREGAVLTPAEASAPVKP